MIGSAIGAAIVGKLESRKNVPAAAMFAAVTSWIALPAMRTARASGRSRAPLHSGQVTCAAKRLQPLLLRPRWSSWRTPFPESPAARETACRRRAGAARRPWASSSASGRRPTAARRDSSRAAAARDTSASPPAAAPFQAAIAPASSDSDGSGITSSGRMPRARVLRTSGRPRRDC